jgi:hypothetical protein
MRRSAGASRPAALSAAAAVDREVHVDVAAYRIRVRARGVRLTHRVCRRFLIQAGKRDGECHGKAEAAILTGAETDRGGDVGIRRKRLLRIAGR